VQPGDVVRIESPGQDFAVERLLLELGAAVADDEGTYERISRERVQQLAFEKGRILPSRQWYLGFCRALRMIEDQLAHCAAHRLMQTPAGITTMFDKRACHALMLAQGVPVPPALPPVQSYEALIATMRSHGWDRVFIKPAHGSSASGVVAYETNGAQQRATSTVEMVQEAGELRLYNSRRMRVYTEAGEVATLIDAVCGQRVHVERWVPKAAIAGASFDLRVVVIAGSARQVVARTSHTPMTNLHLLNARGDLAAVRERLGENAWQAALATCEQAMAIFPWSLYAGIDLLIERDYRRHAVLEINAFGDLLPNALHQGGDTYTLELQAMRAGYGRSALVVASEVEVAGPRQRAAWEMAAP
jgi:glutathione synthase/RimK-type ligase-like ATP-grasp enzyme